MIIEKNDLFVYPLKIFIFFAVSFHRKFVLIDDSSIRNNRMIIRPKLLTTVLTAYAAP